jgi:hypothetical protein
VGKELYVGIALSLIGFKGDGKLAVTLNKPWRGRETGLGKEVYRHAHKHAEQKDKSHGGLQTPRKGKASGREKKSYSTLILA